MVMVILSRSLPVSKLINREMEVQKRYETR